MLNQELGDWHARQGQFQDAEKHLTECWQLLKNNTQVPPIEMIGAIRDLHSFYRNWNLSEPGKGHGVRAAECQKECETLEQKYSERLKPKGRAQILNDKVWRLIAYRQPNLPVARSALADARRALELDPDDALIRNTLGVAQYRMGYYYEDYCKEAIKTLTESQQQQGENPYDLIFIAMAQQQLGKHELALAGLKKVRESPRLIQWTYDDPQLEWVIHEAENLIERMPLPPSPSHWPWETPNVPSTAPFAPSVDD